MKTFPCFIDCCKLASHSIPNETLTYKYVVYIVVQHVALIAILKERKKRSFIGGEDAYVLIKKRTRIANYANIFFGFFHIGK